jgi:hypothetical protein
MSKKEINGLFFWRESHWMPCGLNLKEKLWWRFMPGVIINVQWPNGPIFKDFMDQYRTDKQLLSADPNDHYRPWLEKNVGRQGWDWNWGVAGTDASENRLTIKIRQKYQDRATIAALKWS